VNVGYVEAVTERLGAWARNYGIDVIAVALTIGAIAESPFIDESNAWMVALCGLATLGLIARRWYPLAGPLALPVSFVIGAIVAPAALQVSTSPFFAAIIAAAVIGAYNDLRHAAAGLAVILAVLVFVDQRFPNTSAGDYIWPGAFFSAAWLVGVLLNQRSVKMRELKAKAERLEHEREEQALAAVAEERARIARELHDVVGHSVSVMTVQASAVRRLLHEDQEKEREALLVVERTGREALAEMRRLVGVLRRPEEAPAKAPQPSLEHLDRLVAQVRDAGLPVDLHVEGDALKLAPGVDLTAYRVIQEGLTNALKHARAKRADVVVRYGQEQVELVVADDGEGNGAGGGGGHGLVGMRERVQVYGGDLDAGPRPGGGYELRARIPVNGT
jgi:signal transduction histidine kinase